MHFSSFAVTTLVLSGAAFAAPAQPRGLADDLAGLKAKLQNATVAGVVNGIVNSVKNPGLTLARVEVVKGLKDTGSAMATVAKQANATGNTGVATFVTQGSAGLAQAQAGVDSIGQALIANKNASIADQKSVALGIKAAQDAIQCMTGAISTPDATLSADIAKAATAVGGLRTGGEGVINAQGKGFAALGLPDNFDQTPPNCGAGAGAAAAATNATATDAADAAAATDATATDAADATAATDATATDAADAADATDATATDAADAADATDAAATDSADAADATDAADDTAADSTDGADAADATDGADDADAAT